MKNRSDNIVPSFLHHPPTKGLNLSFLPVINPKIAQNLLSPDIVMWQLWPLNKMNFPEVKKINVLHTCKYSMQPRVTALRAVTKQMWQEELQQEYRLTGAI